MDRLTRLEKELAELKKRLDALTGHQEGPITMRDVRIAAERGDKLVIEKYWEQESNAGRIGAGNGR